MMSNPASSEVFLNRQPILNSQQEQVGCELMSGNGDGEASDRSPTDAARLVCAAYGEPDVRHALGHHTIFLRTDPEFLYDDAVGLLPVDGVVIQLMLEQAPDGKLLERCRTLREQRHSLALADYRGLDERSSPLLTLVDFIGIDVRDKDARQLAALTGPLARLPLKLLAQGVDTPEDFAHCRDSGFQCFQGLSLAPPEAVEGRRPAVSRTTLLRLVELVERSAESADVEACIERDPALVLKLFSIASAIAHDFSRRIGSLHQAVHVLGRRRLKRWLYLLSSMTPADADCAPPLKVAALRAYMLKTLAGRLRSGSDTEFVDRAFITGLMSMVPAALDLSMDEILKLVTLEQEIVAALRGREGPLGALLALIECYDDENAEGCDRCLAGFANAGFDRALLDACLTNALRWFTG
ncbi:MAG: HDOD domain-containing protein [Candidatus Accumulibacter sp.]|jgi:EAL and modified HD-GYP domain-containing signal transduction protein|nr:HDOD domain-containing protein [Accumulibacter sp.]